MSIPQNPATAPLPSTPASHFHAVPVEPSTWERISNYVSEHKVAVYTIGAVVVAVGAGGIYYYSTQTSTKKPGETRPGKERRRKGDRKKKEVDASKEKGKDDGEILRFVN